MATITTYLAAPDTRPEVNPGPTPLTIKISLAANSAASGDDISVMVIPKGWQLIGMTMHVSGTLGASCTAQLRIGTTALTPATTAGGASGVIQNAVAAPHATADQTLNILIGGAAQTTAATIVISGFMMGFRQVGIGA